MSGDHTLHQKIPPGPPRADIAGRPIFESPKSFFDAMDRMQSLELERRTLILASSLACSMDHDFMLVQPVERTKIIDIWTDTWLRPDWAMSTKAGKNTASQIQFVARYIEIMQLMHDKGRTLLAQQQYTQARSNVYAQ